MSQSQRHRGGLIAPTIGDAIRELEREQAQRDRVYRRWVQEGKMKQHDAEWRQECLDAALDALRGIRNGG